MIGPFPRKFNDWNCTQLHLPTPNTVEVGPPIFIFQHPTSALDVVSLTLHTKNAVSSFVGQARDAATALTASCHPTTIVCFVQARFLTGCLPHPIGQPRRGGDTLVDEIKHLRSADVNGEDRPKICGRAAPGQVCQSRRLCDNQAPKVHEYVTRTMKCNSSRTNNCIAHDNSWPVALKFMSIGASALHDPEQIVMTLDHDVQNKTEKNLQKYRQIEDFAKKQGVEFYPAGRGIGHQIMIEEGYSWPGTLVVASDSHSNMYGGVGCLGTPIVRTDAASIWATGKTWWQVPNIAKVVCILTNSKVIYIYAELSCSISRVFYLLELPERT